MGIYKHPRVKICGITNLKDAKAAVEYGADALGFIFHKSSPRVVSVDKVLEIVKELPPFISAVGVFVDTEIGKVREVARRCLLDTIQLHGNEKPDYCLEVGRIFRVIKAVRVKDEKSLEHMRDYYSVSGFLLDSYSKDVFGGSGEKFDWTLAKSAKKVGKIILAGGLNPVNVREAVREVQPYAVDVSSGLEKEPGRKDHEKLKAFFEALESVIK